MINEKTILILYSGYSVNNTPKIKNLITSLREDGYIVSLAGIVKENTKIDIDIDVRYLFAKNKKQGLGKIFIVSLHMTKLLFHLHFYDKSKKIYAINPIAGLLAYIVSFSPKKVYIYESHELFFGVNYPFFRGRWRHLWASIEKIIASRAIKFVTTDKYRERFIRRYYHLNDEKLEYILNVPMRTKERDNSIIRKELSLPDKKIISYCGGICEGRGIEEITEAYSKLVSKQEETYLLLAGSISDEYRKELEILIKSYGIDSNDVRFTGELNNEVLVKYLSASDVTFALYKNDILNNRMCSPNKVFDALHNETFVITTKSMLTQEIVFNNNIGWVLDVLDTDNILRCLSDYINLHTNSSSEIDWTSLKDKYSWQSEYSRIKLLFDIEG